MPHDTDHFLTKRFWVLPPSTGVDANWHVTDKDDTCVAHCFGFAHNIQGGEPLARRIAAALNACQGIPTDELEKRHQHDDDLSASTVPSH